MGWITQCPFPTPSALLRLEKYPLSQPSYSLGLAKWLSSDQGNIHISLLEELWESHCFSSKRTSISIFHHLFFTLVTEVMPTTIAVILEQAGKAKRFRGYQSWNHRPHKSVPSATDLQAFFYLRKIHFYLFKLPLVKSSSSVVRHLYVVQSNQMIELSSVQSLSCV